MTVAPVEQNSNISVSDNVTSNPLEESSTFTSHFKDALFRLDHASHLTPTYRTENEISENWSNSKACHTPPARCYIPRRHIVTLLSFLGFANLYAIRSNLSVAIIQMSSNSTQKNNETGFNWDSKTQGEILGSFFYGYIVTQVPGGWMASRFSGKYVLFLGVFGSAVFTLISVPVAKFGKTYLMIARAVQGAFQGVAYPAMHAILGNWALKMEKTRMSALVYAGSYFGTLIAMPLSAFLGHYGWPVVFYFFGGLAIIWCVFWLIFFTDLPKNAKGISTEELLLFKQEEAERRKSTEVPWERILLSVAVWCIIVSHVSMNWGFYTMLTSVPRIIQSLLGYSPDVAGTLSALPYLGLGLALFFTGPFVDQLRKKFKWWTIIRARKIFCFIGFFGAGIFMLVAAIHTHPLIRLIAIVLSVTIEGLAYNAIFANSLDIAPQYAGHIMGISNTFATIPGIVEPIFVGAIVTVQVSECLIDF